MAVEVSLSPISVIYQTPLSLLFPECDPLQAGPRSAPLSALTVSHHSEVSTGVFSIAAL